jgi:FkbM family methyltransferase
MRGFLRSIRRGFRRAEPTPDTTPDTARLVGLLAAHGVDHVLDVGANRGQYAAMLRRAGYAGRITSFEPLADTHRALTAAAAGDARWQIAPPMALGAAEGRVTMHVSHRSDMSSTLPIAAATLEAVPRAFTTGSEEVALRRLDAVFAAHVAVSETVFLKLDTQGSERAILDGAAGILDRLAGIQLELSLLPLYDGEATYLEMLRLIEGWGFAPHLFIPGPFSKRLNRQLQMDGVLFRG